MTIDQATYAQQCCPFFALRALTPDDLRHLDAYCRRALHDEDADVQRQLDLPAAKTRLAGRRPPA